MMYKSIKYYRKTSWLKLAAFGVAALDRFSFLEKYIAGNHKKFTALYHRDFAKGLEDTSRFDQVYLPYAFLNSPMELARHLKFDINGIPIGRIDANPKHYNPLFSCYYGLVSYNAYLHTNEQENIDKFLLQVDFLNQYGIENPSGFWLPYYEDLPKFQLKAPWFAGITQALAISVFIRAFIKTNQKIYRQRAMQLFQTFFLSVENGGFLKHTPEGFSWIEEYPSKNPTYVLNGFVFNLIALVEYYKVIDESIEVKERLNACFKSFFYSLHHYVFGMFTKYSRKNMAFSNIEYQGLYVFLFLHLYRLTGKPAFREMADFYNQNTDWELFFSFYQIQGGHERIVPYFNLI